MKNLEFVYNVKNKIFYKVIIMKKFINLLLVIVVTSFLFVSIQANEEDCTSLYQVTATQLNVRDQASTKGNVIGALYKDDQICISQEHGNWGKTSSGWVSTNHLISVSQTSSINQVNTAHIPYNNSPALNGVSSTVPKELNMDDKIATSLFVLIIAVYIIMLMVGMAGKVVVYYDEADLVISLLPWLILFVTVLVTGIYQPNEQDLNPEKMLQIQQFIWYAGGIFAIGFSVWAIQLSIKYNRSILLGLVYGIFKLLSGLIGVLVLISQVFTMKDEKTKRKDFWFAILVFGAFWWMGKKLINGKKVYRDKGWTLST